MVSGLFAWLQARANIKVQLAKDVAAAELARVAQQQLDERAKEDQPVMHFQKLVEMYERRLDKLETAHEDCEKSHKDCLETTGNLKGEVGELKGKVTVLMDLVRENFSLTSHGAQSGDSPTSSQTLQLRGNPPIKPGDVMIVVEDPSGVHPNLKEVIQK